MGSQARPWSCLPRNRYTLLLVMPAPFFTSYPLPVYAWPVIPPAHGTLNSLLERIGLVDPNHPASYLAAGLRGERS
jgi:ABC-type spermidine/putrescine transport system permease subunit I